MGKKEYLIEIQKGIEFLSEKKLDKEVQMVNQMVQFRKNHSTPELQSLIDIFYFINGILYAKGLSDHWNGRKLE